MQVGHIDSKPSAWLSAPIRPSCGLCLAAGAFVLFFSVRSLVRVCVRLLVLPFRLSVRAAVPSVPSVRPLARSPACPLARPFARPPASSVRVCARLSVRSPARAPSWPSVLPNVRVVGLGGARVDALSGGFRSIFIIFYLDGLDAEPCWSECNFCTGSLQ